MTFKYEIKNKTILTNDFFIIFIEWVNIIKISNINMYNWTIIIIISR